jgi:hypothetical protein
MPRKKKMKRAGRGGGRPRREPTKVETTVADAVNTCFTMLEELAGEMRGICDNTHENLQNSDLYSRRDETASALEGIRELTVPDSVGDLPVVILIQPPKRRNRISRSYRCAEACQYGTAAVEVLEAMEKIPQDQQEEIESLITEIQEMVETAEGVEFPGMYG